MKTRLSVVALFIILFIASGVCAEVVELDVWVTEPRPIYKKYHEEHAKAFMKLHPNIKINVTLMGWTDAYVKWVSSLSAEDPPDISYMIQSWLGYLETLEMGGFLDVSDIVDKLGREYWRKRSIEKTRHWLKPRLFWS